MKLITIPVHEDIDKIKAQLLEDTGIDMTYSQVFNWLIHFYKQRKPLTVWREDMTLKLLPHAAGDLMPATLVYTVKEVDKLQSAEIEGWKKDQKENLRNQCDLHAEIERLKTVPMKYRRMTFNAELQNEVTALHAERERLKNDDNHICGHMIAVDALRAENQKLRDANILLDAALVLMCPQGAQGYVFEMWNAARAALENTVPQPTERTPIP